MSDTLLVLNANVAYVVRQSWESPEICLCIINKEGFVKQIQMTAFFRDKAVSKYQMCVCCWSGVNCKSAYPFVYLLFQDIFETVFNSFIEEVQDPAGEKRKEGQKPLYDSLKGPNFPHAVPKWDPARWI